jgi:hypothetical protein
MSFYFLWVRIRVRVVEYDWYNVDWCIEYIVHAGNKVVLRCGMFGQLSSAPDLCKTS